MLFALIISLTVAFLGIIVLVFLFHILLPVIRGAPFVPTRNKKLKRAIELVGLAPGQKIVDLGSGDGRILIAAAKKGAKAYGFEISPFLVLRAKVKIRRAGLKNTAFCSWKSFWSEDLSSFDVVFVYGITYIMKYLERKLQKELKPGAKVVSFAFTFPNWQPSIADENGIFIYEKNLS